MSIRMLRCKAQALPHALKAAASGLKAAESTYAWVAKKKYVKKSEEILFPAAREIAAMVEALGIKAWLE